MAASMIPPPTTTTTATAAATSTAATAVATSGKPRRQCNDKAAVEFWNALTKHTAKKTELDAAVFSDALAKHFQAEYPPQIVHSIVDNIVRTFVWRIDLCLSLSLCLSLHSFNHS